MYEVKANIYCTPSMNCEVLDGFQLFQLGDIDNESQCEGYADFMNISTELFQNSINELTVTTGYGDQYVKVWIDFNDDLEFTNEEDKDGDVPEIDYVKHSMFRYLFNRLKKIEKI